MEKSAIEGFGEVGKEGLDVALMNKYDQKMKVLADFPYNVPADYAVHLSDEELDAVERELGHTLPADYREFLRDYSGYSIIACFLFSEGHEPAYAVCEGFFAVASTKPRADLVTHYKRKGPPWPSHLLPIGAGDNGYTCLVISGSEKGAVYFWHTGEDGGDPTPEHIHFVASSFDEFINRLET